MAEIHDSGVSTRCTVGAGKGTQRTLNAARPITIAAAKKMKAWMSQMTPHTCEGKHPHMWANADASDEFTLRAIVSSSNASVVSAQV